MFFEEFEVVEVNEIHGIYFCPPDIQAADK